MVRAWSLGLLAALWIGTALADEKADHSQAVRCGTALVETTPLHAMSEDEAAKALGDACSGSVMTWLANHPPEKRPVYLGWFVEFMVDYSREHSRLKPSALR